MDGVPSMKNGSSQAFTANPRRTLRSRRPAVLLDGFQSWKIATNGAGAVANAATGSLLDPYNVGIIAASLWSSIPAPNSDLTKSSLRSAQEEWVRSTRHETRGSIALSR